MFVTWRKYLFTNQLGLHIVERGSLSRYQFGTSAAACSAALVCQRNGWVLIGWFRFYSKRIIHSALLLWWSCVLGLGTQLLSHPPRGWGCLCEPIHLACVLSQKVYSALQTLGRICLKNLYIPRTKVTYMIVELLTLIDLECLSCDWPTEHFIGFKAFFNFSAFRPINYSCIQRYRNSH